MQRHATLFEGGVNGAVPDGNIVPKGAFGVTINEPLPAAVVVVIVMTPVASPMVSEAMFLVAAGAVKPNA